MEPQVLKYAADDPYGGNEDSWTRLTEAQLAAAKRSQQDPAKSKSKKGQYAAFSFAAMFPNTHRQLTSGRFRWVRYDNKGGNSSLRIVAGVSTDRVRPPNP